MRETPERVWLYRDPAQNLRLSYTKPSGDATEYQKVEGQVVKPARPKLSEIVLKNRSMPKVMNRAAKPKVTK